jgi:hypothetical protein
MIIDRAQLSEFLGISKSRIMQLARDGVLDRVGRGQYDAAACVQAFIAFKLEGGQSGSSDVNDARRRLYEVQTQRAELENSRIRRETIPSDEFQIDMCQLAILFTGGLDALTGRLSSVLPGDQAVNAELILKETSAVREAVADQIAAYARSLIHV